MWSDLPGKEQADRGAGRDVAGIVCREPGAAPHGCLVHIGHQLAGQSVVLPFERHVSRELREWMLGSGEQVVTAGSEQMNRCCVSRVGVRNSFLKQPSCLRTGHASSTNFFN